MLYPSIHSGMDVLSVYKSTNVCLCQCIKASGAMVNDIIVDATCHPPDSEIVILMIPDGMTPTPLLV